VLGNGLKYESIAIAAEQSQLAEQLGLTAVDVATAFGMPAYKINQGPMPTNNNVQALNQQYYTDCLQTHIEDIELCSTKGSACRTATASSSTSTACCGWTA
jgi:phage portal protein BeeE